MATNEIMEKIGKVQAELKAPKDQYNSFGEYKYRSAESILEAVKPLLAKHGLVQTLSDEIIEAGGRVYVRATATVQNQNGDQCISVTAYAREPDTKKGMDESQITGTASSYARKYALNGLWLIDDTKDADTDEYRRQTADDQRYGNAKPNGEYLTSQEARALAMKSVNAHGVERGEIVWKDMLMDFGVSAETLRRDKLDEYERYIKEEK